MDVADNIYYLCIDDYHSGILVKIPFKILNFFDARRKLAFSPLCCVRIRSLTKTFDVLKWNVNSCLLLAVF